MTYKNVRPSQVILDPQNPRLPDGTSSDREAINQLLDDDAGALINLARDMARSGQTNPAELPIAIKSGSKYLVLEGNRRFAALKLLGDPALADDPDHQAAFRRAAALGAPPKTVFTLISASREEADHWIVLRHTGENNGRGVKGWSAGQAATHRRRANKPVDSGTLRSITIADQVEAAYVADAELVALVRQVRREKLTNIGRLFSSDVMTRLHFSTEVDEGSALRERYLLTRHTRGQLRDFFVWAFSLLLDKTVDAFKNPDTRRDLLLTIPQLIPADADASPVPIRLVETPAPTVVAEDSSDPHEPDEDGEDVGGENNAHGADAGGDEGHGGTDGQASGTGTPASNGTAAGNGNSGAGRREARPEKFLLQGLKLPSHPARIQKLLQECRRLEMEVYPSIACVMVRVIVELSVSSPQALILSGKQEGDNLKDKIIAMLRFLDSNIEHGRRRDKELEQAYIEVVGDSGPAGPGMQYLNGFVHNPGVNPDPHLARRFSQAFRPFLLRIDSVL